MSNAPKTETQRETVNDPMNRRDFARVAAMGAATIVAALPTRAMAQPPECTPLGKLVDSTEDAYVGEKCARLLKRLYKVDCNITLDTLLYGSYYTLITKIAVEETDTTLKTLLQQLAAAIQKFNDGQSSGTEAVRLADLYTHDEYNLPHGSGNKADWQAIHHAGRVFDSGGKKTLYENYPFVYLDLSTHYASKHRTVIKNFLFPSSGTGDSEFRNATGHYKYIELYTKDHKEACKDVAGKYHPRGYKLVRDAFELGILSTPRARYTLEKIKEFEKEQGDEAKILNNGKPKPWESGRNGECWSTQTPVGCKEGDDGDHCNDVGGSPSTSSDICD